jgi:outer membrane protein
MKDRIKVIATALTITLASVANAQNKRPISLNEAIDLSVKNSKQLKINKAKVEQASAAVTQAI